MRKKMVALLLSLCLLLSAASAEGFVDTEADAPQFGEGQNVSSMASVNGLLYLLYANGILTSVKPATREETMLATLPVGMASAAAAQDGAPTISRLFSQDKKLCGLQIETGKWYVLLDEGGAFAPVEMPAKLDLSSLYSPDTMSYAVPTELCAVDGSIYFLTDESIGSRDGNLFSVDLQTGKATAYKTENIVSLSSYKDGLLLACQFDTQALYTTGALDKPALYGTFNPATDLFSPLGTFSNNGMLGGNGATDLRYGASSLYYTRGSCIEGRDLATGETRVSAYTGAGMFGDFGFGLACYVADGYFAKGGSSGWALYALDTDAVKRGALRIFGEIGTDAHKAFLKNYPDIPVEAVSDYSTSLESLTTAMVSGSDAYDVLRLNVSQMPVTSLMKKGYCEDLSAYPEIMERVAKMDKRFVDAMSMNGKLYGVPVQVSASTFGVNMEQWTGLGLTEEDLPTNWIELFDFIDNYQYDYGDDHPELRLFNVGDVDSMRSMLFAQLLNDLVVDAQRSGGRLSFNNDRVRTLFTAFGKIHFKDLDMGSTSSQDFWSQPSLFSSYQSVTELRGASFGASTENVAMPLALLPDEQPLIGAQIEVLTINPRSLRKADAVKYICNYLDNLDDNASILIYPDDNEPRINAEIVKAVDVLKRAREDKQKQLEAAADADKAALKNDVEMLDMIAAQYEAMKYSITAEAIAGYRERFAPMLVAVPQNVIYSSDGNASKELDKLRDQYLAGTLAMENYLREMDKRVRMMYLESI